MQPLTEAEILARVLHRDGMVLVIDKPAGIAVHVTGHDKIALDQSFQHLQFGLPKKPELAHRLDRGTSGCLVLGRHRQALIKLGKLFESQKVNKTYRAICVGVPTEPSGIIKRPILKTGQGSKWKMLLDDAGQEATTEYRVLRTLRWPAPPLRGSQIAPYGDLVGGNEAAANSGIGNYVEVIPPTETLKERFDSPSRGEFASGADGGQLLSEILFFPKTGRTHQIRLHAAYALGCPVVGDPFYGLQEGEFSASELPMMLHAESVEIPLQQSKPPIKVSAPLPGHMVEMLERWKNVLLS